MLLELLMLLERLRVVSLLCLFRNAILTLPVEVGIYLLNLIWLGKLLFTFVITWF